MRFETDAIFIYQNQTFEHLNSKSIQLMLRVYFFKLKIMPGKDFHEHDQVGIALHSALLIKSSVKGYLAYIDIWTPVMNEKLAALTWTQ